MLFGLKAEKSKNVFAFMAKVNFFSKAHIFFFNVVNQQSKNEGLSSQKKLLLLKGVLSVVSRGGFDKTLELNTFLTENFLTHG